MSAIYLKGSGFAGIAPGRFSKNLTGTNRLPVLPPAAKLADQQLKKILVVRRARFRRNAQARADHVRDAPAVELSHPEGDLQPPGQKCLNQLGLLHRKARSLVQSEFGARWSIEESGRFAVGSLVHHNGSSNVVTQPPVLCVQQHGEDAHAVKAGKEINRPHEVSHDGFKGVDGPSGILDHPYSRPALARRLSFPQRLENGVITPIDAEDYQRDYSRPPDGTVGTEEPTGNPEQREEQEDEIENQLDESVKKERHETAADAGHHKFQVDLLRSI